MNRKIKVSKTFDKDLVAAVTLGLAALLANVYSHWLFPNEHASTGALFLFWAAACLRPYHTFVSVCVGTFPEAIYTGEVLYGLRQLVLCCAINWVAAYKPKLPIFVTTLMMWLTVFLPLGYALQNTALMPASMTKVSLVSTALQEILLAMITGSLLIKNSIWSAIRLQPRHITIKDLLLQIIPLTAMLTLLLPLSLNRNAGHILNFGLTPSNAISTLILAVMVIAATSLMALRLAYLLERDIQHFFSKKLMSTNASFSFSGLFSDYWRRHSVTNLPRYSLPDNEETKSHEQQRRISAATNEVGICAVTRTKTIVFFNQRFKELAELRDSDALGKPLEALKMNPQISTCLNALIERTFSKGPKTIEIKINQLPHKLRFIEASSRLSDESGSSTLDGESGNVIVSIRDISDRRTIENHLLKGQRLSSLSNLIRGISHSINNSMATIIGQASAAQYCFEIDRVKRALEQIISAAREVGALVRQLLEFAEADPARAERSQLDVLINDHLKLLKKIVGEHIEIIYQPPPQPLQVVFERNLILQALTNLVINSKEAIGARPGSITISLSSEHIDEEVADLMNGARAGNFARISVSDNGCGMNPEVLSHAFEPLFTTKASNGNAGLGLAVVYSIVRSLDGFLSMESHVGRGTTAAIYLPLAPALGTPTEISYEDRTTQPVSPKEVQAVPTPCHAKILVVEDDHNVRQVVAAMLSTLGYEVSSCSSGAEALAQCDKTHFDLVLADLIMPGMNGSELINLLRNKANTPKTLLMTAYGITQDSPNSTNRVIAKPFDIDALAQTISEVLNSPG